MFARVIHYRLPLLSLVSLALVALACNIGGEAATQQPSPPPTTMSVVASPTPTSLPVCTPPACQPGEVYYCAGECYGGCGTTCATVTAEAPPAFVPPDAPAANATFEGISFYFDNSIATDWTVEIVPADVASGQPEAWLVPSHYRFTFNDYPVANTVQSARILIFPVKNWQDYNSYGLAEIERLKNLLAGAPATDRPELPMLPIYNAGQIFRAQVEPLNFQNGKGVRFLTQLAQNFVVVNNAELFYTFQGLTNDGNYYVAVFFPVTHPDLPADGSNPGDVIGDNYTAYLEGAVQALDATEAIHFSPSLITLDTIIQSLTVK